MAPTATGVGHFAHLLKILLLVYGLFQGPIYFTRWVIAGLNYLGFHIMSKTVMDTVDIFVSRYLNPHVFLVVLLGFFIYDWDAVFLAGSSTAMLTALAEYPPRDTVESTGMKSRFHYMVKSSPQFREFLSRYLKMYLFNTGVFLLVHIFPQYKVAPILLSFFVSQALLDRIGAFYLLVVVAVLNCVDYQWLAILLTLFHGTGLLARDLVIPYFNRIPFTTFERIHWTKLREGVMWGFTLVFWMLMNVFPMASFWVFAFAQFSTGHFISTLSGVPPTRLAFYKWTQSQITWKN